MATSPPERFEQPQELGDDGSRERFSHQRFERDGEPDDSAPRSSEAVLLGNTVLACEHGAAAFFSLKNRKVQILTLGIGIA